MQCVPFKALISPLPLNGVPPGLVDESAQLAPTGPSGFMWGNEKPATGPNPSTQEAQSRGEIFGQIACPTPTVPREPLNDSLREFLEDDVLFLFTATAYFGLAGLILWRQNTQDRGAK